MQLVGLTVQQLCIMFIYLAAGFVLYRLKIITAAGSREMAGLLVKMVIPAVIINSFCTEFSPERLKALGISALTSALLLGLAIGIARLFFKNRPIDNFAAAFSNAGFMGIPLVSAVLGTGAVFYIAALVALLNFLQWTYGVDVMREKRSHFSLKVILWNPLAVSMLAGILLFVTGLGAKMPGLIKTAVAGVSGLNTPLAMLILGVYLAQEDLKKLLSEPSLYRLCAVRLIVIPLISLGVLWALPIQQDIALALLICASAPVGSNVAVYAQLNGKDYSYASRTVVASTLLSLATLPAITALAQKLL